MTVLKRRVRLVLIIASLLILIGSVGVTAYLLFSNYQQAPFNLAEKNHP